jgi:hypothetical protein
MPKKSKSSSSKEPAAFQFITSSGPPNQLLNDPEAVRAIKSHVMLKFQHKKRSLDSRAISKSKGADRKVTRAESQSSSSTSDESSIEFQSSKSQDSNSDNEDSNALTIVHATSAYDDYGDAVLQYLEWQKYVPRARLNGRDPFDSLALSSTPASHMLVDFYAQTFPRKTIPANPTQAFLQKLLCNPTTMHAVLTLSAVNYRLHVADPGLGAIEYHRNVISTIRLINIALDDPQLRHGDPIIGAIALLSMNEVFYPLKIETP